MARSSVGLDIGTRAVRAVEVRGTGDKATITRFGRVLLPEGAVDHGEVMDPMAVASTIQRLWQRLDLSTRSVHLGLANRRVVVRVVELPAMKREDLENAIKLQAQDHIPIPLAEAVMDYQLLEEVTGPEGQAIQRVLVVAAERTTIQPLLAAIAAAKLEPGSLELNAYPLIRSLGNGSAGAEAIVDIGAGITNIVIHEGPVVRFTRILPNVGGDDFTEAIVEGLGIEWQEAETLKRRLPPAPRPIMEEPEPEPEPVVVQEPEPSPGTPSLLPKDDFGDIGSEDPASPFESQGFGPSAEPPSLGGEEPASGPAGGLDPSFAQPTPQNPEEHARMVIEPVMERFVSEVRRSIDFYSSQPEATPLERVIVTGGGSLLVGLPEALGETLDAPTEVGHPFEKAPIAGIRVPAHQLKVAERYMGVAVGLALAGMGS